MGGVLAAAEVDGFGFSGLEFYGREFAALVASVAEGLAGAAAAGAPVVALAGFDFDGVGTSLGNDGFWHGEHSLKSGTDIIADGGEVLASRERNPGVFAVEQRLRPALNCRLPNCNTVEGILFVNRIEGQRGDSSATIAESDSHSQAV
jgi:hypothetical protein